MDVRGFTGVADAALWIAERFAVPLIPKQKHLVERSPPKWSIGLENALGVLIRCGLWARLSESTRSIAPVLVEYADRNLTDGTLLVKMSYRGISRYSGVRSPNGVSKALDELVELGWLRRVSKTNLSPDLRRPVGEYLITPHDDQFLESANHSYTRHRIEIEAERELRRRMQKKRIDVEAIRAQSACLLSKDSLFVE